MSSIKRNKETGKWEFYFDLGKSPLTAKRKQIKRRGFNTRKEAVQEMVRLHSEMLESEITELDKIDYKRYMEEWFEERKFQIEKSTWSVHHTYYKNIIEPKLGHFKLQQLRPIHIQHFINRVVNENDYSERTIHLIYRIVSASLKKAEVLQLIKRNPAVGLTVPKIKRKEMKVWTLEEVNKFLTDAKAVKRLTRCFIGFAIGVATGIRQGEVLGLRWRDIDYKNRIIYINQTLTQDGTLKSGAKTASGVRAIHIPESLIFLLKGHFKFIEKEKKNLKLSYQDNDLVVCKRNGEPMYPRNFRKEFYNLIEKLDLPKIRFQDLRHTHATILIQQNINVKLISERLGHSSVIVTLDTYSHVIPSMQQEVSDKLESILTI